MECAACPGEGACGGQFTANTMATAFAMLGVSPMGFNDVPAPDPHKEEIAFQTGRLAMDVLRKGLTPRQIITKKSLYNSIAGVMATGGSTNAVLHLLAVAKEAGVKLTIDEFDRISRKTPLLADMKPWGNFTAPEMHDAGGMGVVARRLLDAGLLFDEGDDRHRPDDRRGGARRARDAGPEGRARARRSDQAGGRPRHPARQPLARRLRGQGLRPEEATCIAGRRGSSIARKTPSPR